MTLKIYESKLMTTIEGEQGSTLIPVERNKSAYPLRVKDAGL